MSKLTEKQKTSIVRELVKRSPKVAEALSNWNKVTDEMRELVHEALEWKYDNYYDEADREYLSKSSGKNWVHDKFSIWIREASLTFRKMTYMFDYSIKRPSFNRGTDIYYMSVPLSSALQHEFPEHCERINSKYKELKDIFTEYSSVYTEHYVVFSSAVSQITTMKKLYEVLPGAEEALKSLDMPVKKSKKSPVPADETDIERARNILLETKFTE